MLSAPLFPSRTSTEDSFSCPVGAKQSCLCKFNWIEFIAHQHKLSIMDLGIEKQRKQTMKQTQGKQFPTLFSRFKASRDSSQSLQRGNGWHRSLGSAHSGFFLLLLLILALIALLWCGFLHRPQALQGRTSSSIGLSMGCSPLASSASFKSASPSMSPSVSPSVCLLLYLHVSPPLSPFASPHMPPFGPPAATALSYVHLSRGTVCSSDQLRSWHRLGWLLSWLELAVLVHDGSWPPPTQVTPVGPHYLNLASYAHATNSGGFWPSSALAHAHTGFFLA